MSRNYEEEYFFFLNNKNFFDFTDRFVRKPDYDKFGPSAKQAFKTFLQFNRWPKKSSQPEDLLELLVCRVTMMDFIKKEAASDNNVGRPVAFFLSSFKDPPKWVLNMYIREFNKAHKEI